MAMSKSTKDILMRVRKFIPPMLEKFHKGQMGRVGVVGGSEDYTGAPYFSANASALLGCDMSHVICEPGAAAVIKTYSPNIMVHPYMRQSTHMDASTSSEDVASKVTSMLDRLHVIVVGPGLGRDVLMQSTARRVILAARERGMGVVIDADGLMVVISDPDVIRGYKNAILTPNVVEFARLCESLNVDGKVDSENACARAAKALGGVTIIQKGGVDSISNGEQTAVCDVKGGLKRSGGQGDTLTGAIATFLGWKKAYMDKLWDHDGALSDEELTALSAFGASALTRTCSRLAFEKKGRHLQASDLQSEIQKAYEILFETEESKL